MHRLALALICAWVTLIAIESRAINATATSPELQRRMSFHNRLLLNRAVLAGVKSIEVLVLVRQAGNDHSSSTPVTAVASHVARVGGRVLTTEADLGYLRIALPPESLVELAAISDVEAYQISSLSNGGWYRDGPPESNAKMFRDSEVKPIVGAGATREYAHLPELTSSEARAPGFTGDEDAGVGKWMKSHPTWDGRGVTIAVLETALPSFSDPVFRTAKTLDGRSVPKIAGILNAIPPDQDDDTRVRLNTAVDATTTWTHVGNRTYVLPRPGKYRMGMLEIAAGGNVLQRFAVLASNDGEAVWIDSNGDASFQDEKPLADVNERFEPRFLALSAPRRLDVSFVMARGPRPDVVHVYLGASGHQSMTVSIAAGNITDESLASGVAPNARVLLVRMHGADYDLGTLVEAFIQTARRTDVDVLTSSMGLHPVPDSAFDFFGLVFSRITTVYKKPIVNGAGNYGLSVAHVHAFAPLSAGGLLGSATYSAFYGGSHLQRPIVHPTSAAGPSLDGSVKPDFLAPVERIAVGTPWSKGLEAVPGKEPTRRVPAGYEISCCTSASSPYAAGVVALLISAARQSNVALSADALSRALRVTARPLEGFQAHQQGNGALDIEAAWRELQRGYDPPRITASANVFHPLAQYSARDTAGVGILEFGNWIAGTRGTRVITLRRDTGPSEPVSYRLQWTAHDGTFSAAPSVTLPLGKPVPLRVDIYVKTTGAHSGLLTLHDTATGAVVFRTQATVVAPAQIELQTASLETAGRTARMEQSAEYLHVPPDAGAIALKLEVSRGVAWTTLIQSHGLQTHYYPQVHPANAVSTRGTYHLLMPNPEPGTWTLVLSNSSMRVPASLKLGPQDDDEVEYALRMRVLSAAIRTVLTAKGVLVEVTNRGSALSNPALQAWSGALRTHRATFPQNGLPKLFEIDVPGDAAALTLDLRADSAKTGVELFLYDCTTGECFSYDIGFPAATSQRLVVRQPAAGRWVAAVNAAPFPTSDGGFVLDEIITTGTPARRSSAVSLQPAANWSQVFTDLPPSHKVQGRTPVVLFELVDDAAEKAEADRPWSSSPKFVNLRDRPVAIATAIYQALAPAGNTPR